ncbi:hypothetical protein DRZ77_03275, partial [Candidatus Woesearchaeota archaeon]
MKIKRVYLTEKIVEEGEILIKVGPFSCDKGVLPGQFFEVRWSKGYEPLIPRPFSLFYQDGDKLVFYVKSVGRFTRSLADANLFKEMLVFGPLGKPFPQKEAYLVG